MSITLWICPDCGGHEFVLITLGVLPYTVAVLCSACGRDTARLEAQDEVKGE